MLIDPVLSIKMSYTRSWDSAKKHLAGKLPCQVFFVKLSLREAARTAVAIRPPVFPVIANRRDTRPRVSVTPSIDTRYEIFFRRGRRPRRPVPTNAAPTGCRGRQPLQCAVIPREHRDRGIRTPAGNGLDRCAHTISPAVRNGLDHSLQRGIFASMAPSACRRPGPFGPPGQ